MKLIWLRAYLQDEYGFSIITELNDSWPKIEGYVLDMPEDQVEAAWRATAVYQLIRSAMNYEVMGSTISPFRPLQPSETLLLDKSCLVAAVTPRLSGWAEADVDRYVNELLAESEMLKKWAGKLASDETRLLGSLQSLARKDLDALRGGKKAKEERRLIHVANGMGVKNGENEDIEMIY